MNWGAIGAVVGITGIAFAAGVWVKSNEGSVASNSKEIESLHEKLKSIPTLPSGAIVAFNLNKCPAGWDGYTELAGRTVIGIGQGSRLTNRNLGDSGGEEVHVLTINEIPSHSHGLAGATEYEGPEVGTTRSFNQLRQWKGSTDPEGGSKAHNNMPPYLALLYCRKQ